MRVSETLFQRGLFLPPPSTKVCVGIATANFEESTRLASFVRGILTTFNTRPSLPFFDEFVSLVGAYFTKAFVDADSSTSFKNSSKYWSQFPSNSINRLAVDRPFSPYQNMINISLLIIWLFKVKSSFVTYDICKYDSIQETLIEVGYTKMSLFIEMITEPFRSYVVIGSIWIELGEGMDGFIHETHRMNETSDRCERFRCGCGGFGLRLKRRWRSLQLGFEFL